MRSRFLVGAAAVAACGSPAAPAPAAPTARAPASAPAPTAETAALDAWADRELADLPSAVVAIVDHGRIVWRRGVGSHDAHGGPAPDPATAVYRIGSITKVLTGTALLQLRDAGRLDLDDAVARWIPELAAHLPGVTIRHLVTHTSGIPSMGDRSAPYWTETPPTEAAVLRALEVPLEFAPGSKVAYSNAGMALGGLIVARASGQRFRAYLGEHVLAPLGMRTAGWDRATVPADRLALGVLPDGTVDPAHWQLGAFESVGGLYASLDDLAGLARLALGETPSVLSATSLAEALTDSPLPGAFGVNWIIGERDGERFATHTGSTYDYTASIVALPDRGIAAIVLSAGDDVKLTQCAAFNLAHAVAHHGPPPPCLPPDLDVATLSAVEIGLTRVRALLPAPSDAALAELFSPSFLAHVPRATIDADLAKLHARVGRCDRHEITSVDHPDRDAPAVVHAVLHCERGDVEVTLQVEDADPRLVSDLRFRDR